MKKLLNISVIAALAILPMAANAAVTDAEPAHDNGTAQVATAEPAYALAATESNDGNLATAGYVKGAYNAAIKAVNKVATTAASALQASDITTGTTDGTINVDGTEVSVAGLGSAAYTASTAYATAAQGTTADQAASDIGTMANLTTTDKTSLVGAINELKTTADGALTASDIDEGETNGTISVDGTDVAVHGLGTAAYTAATAYATSAQGTTADQAASDIGTMSNLTTTEKGSLVGAINELKTTADGAVQSVTTGTTDGTINVDGTEVSVAGLGSAAYENTNAFATAAQGTKADNAETNIGTMSNLTTTEKGSLVGAINELKTASGDYATKTGVLATINASTVPVMATWGSNSATTVSVGAPANFVNQ